MDRLRFILIILGVALIAGIFVWELVKKRAAARRRAALVEHLSEDERRPLAGESVLGEIGSSDPFEIVERAQGRRSGDRPPVPEELEPDAEVALDGYDIDEDFPGEPQEDVTETPSSVADASGGEREALGTLGSLAVRRDAPEQLDLAGLEFSAPMREGATPGERRAFRGPRRIGRGPDPGADPSSAARRQGPGIARKVEADNDEELHIVMTVMARHGERFSGEALRLALEHADLYHGEMNIFHRHASPKDRATPTLFSAANVLAPGHFEPERMDSQTSPGIAMFMRLPGPERPADAFQQMLDAAKIVAQDLNGTLCDETRSTLTPQSINHLRERIADFRRRQMLKA